jgi:hypothetical protein
MNTALLRVQIVNQKAEKKREKKGKKDTCRATAVNRTRTSTSLSKLLEGWNPNHWTTEALFDDGEFLIFILLLFCKRRGQDRVRPGHVTLGESRVTSMEDLPTYLPTYLPTL